MATPAEMLAAAQGTTATLAARPSGGNINSQDNPSSQAENTSQQPKTKHERIDFLPPTDTGNATLHKEKILTKEFEFTPEVTAQQTQFLEKEVTRLMALQRDNPKVFNQPDFMLQQKLLASLTSAEKNPDGSIALNGDGNPIIKRDDQAIKDFLNTSGGRITAIQAMEESILMESLGLTVTLSVLPPGERQQMIRQMLGREAIRFGIDQGPLDRGGNTVMDWLNARVTQVGGRTNTALPGSFLQNLTRGEAITLTTIATGINASIGALVARGLNGTPEQTAVAAGAGAVATLGLIGGDYLFRTGVTLELRQCAQAFNVIKKNPAKAAYLKATAGIDVADWEVDPATNNIRRSRIAAPGGGTRDRVALTTSISESRRAILEKFATRMQFYQDIGVKQQDLDATPEQFLHRYNNFQQEQANTTWGKRIEEKFNSRRDGIRDTQGHRENSQNFDPAQPDITGNLKRFMKARQLVAVEMMDEYIRNHIEKGSLETPIESMQNKYASLAENGEGRIARKGETTARITRLNADQTTVSGERTSLETYNANITTLQTARENLQRELTGISVNGTNLTTMTVEDAITQLARVNEPLAIVIINGRTITSITDRTAAVEAAIIAEETAAIGALPVIAGESPDSRTRREERTSNRVLGRHQHELDAINRDSAFIQDFIRGDADNPGRLRKLQTEIQKGEASLIDNGAEGIATAGVINNLSTEFNYLTGAPPAGLGIPDVNLRPPRTLEQIITDINGINAANPTLGWAEAQNNRPEIRMRVIHGIIEARARAVEPLIGAPTVDLEVFINPPAAVPPITNGWGITENQLRTLTDAQITQITASMRARLIPGIPAADPTPAEIQAGRLIATQRFTARLRAFTEQNTEISEQLRQEEFSLTGIDAQCDKDREEIKMIMEQMKIKRGESMKMANTVLVGQQPNKFTESRTLTTADRGYQDAERTAGQPRGYYELMNLIFDYQNSATRAQSFQTAQRILPPDELARHLNDSLGLNLPPGYNLTHALDLIAGSRTVTVGVGGPVVPARTVLVGNLVSAFNDICNTIVERGRAIQ